MTEQTKAVILSSILSTIGFGIVIVHMGWLLAFGIFLLLWGNNIFMELKK